VAVWRGFLWSLLGIFLLLFGLLVWFALSARAAVDEMTAARDGLVAARDAVGDSQPAQAKTFVTAASASAEAASKRVNSPLWDITAAVPGLGDTPRAAQAIATSLSQALTALRPLTDHLDVLDPSALISDKGRIDVAALESAVPAMKEAQPGLDAAVTTMADAPTSGLMIPQVSSAATDFTDQLASLQSSLNTAVRFGEIAGPLLGADGEKRYFVGILNPNEARGTGGFLGSYVILSAKDGRISFDQAGSNTELPKLDKLPPGLGKDFVRRYGEDPILRGNMNLSPHFPNTARIWLASWQKKTGDQLDGAIAADVVALGDVVQASGERVALPDGGSISGEQLAQFEVEGIYDKFPSRAQAAERKAYQEAITTSAASILTLAPSPKEMAEALGQGLTMDRVVVWSADVKVQRKLVDAGVGGSLAVGDSHNVHFVTLNGSGSKLDAFLQRSLKYEVGRCVNSDGEVKSRVTVDLTSHIPLGERPPASMISLAMEGPTGPINVVLAQMHLPNGAEIDEVKVNGKSVGYSPFKEQGRPSAVLSLKLPPRKTKELTFDFREPASNGPGVVAIQPLRNEQETEVVDAACKEGQVR
jgi:hypothetical protein